MKWVLASVGGFSVGYVAWSTHSPAVLILTMAAAIGLLIGGIVGSWSYLGGEHGRGVRRFSER